MAEATGRPPDIPVARARKDPRDNERAEARRPEADGLDSALDPAVRHAAMLAPPQQCVPAVAAFGIDGAASGIDRAASARMSLEELLPHVVRRIAWWGDKHRGAVRLEIGAGSYEGTTVVVHADAGRVRVEVSGAGNLERLRENLDARLRRHGLDVDSVV